MSQKDEILRHLQTRGPITPLQALDEYGVYRLSAVILILRKEGHRIITDLMPGKGNGRYAKYRLA